MSYEWSSSVCEMTMPPEALPQGYTLWTIPTLLNIGHWRPGMPIRFRCGYCNRLLGIARRKAGTETNCPHCGYAITVPVPDDARDDGESAANMDEIDAAFPEFRLSRAATTPSPSPVHRTAPSRTTCPPRHPLPLPALLPGPAAARGSSHARRTAETLGTR